MNDLSLFETAWQAAAHVPAKVQYQRLCAAGGEWTRASLKEGRIANFELGSNLRVEALRCSKKNKSFQSRVAVFGDFASLDKLASDSDHLFYPVPSSDDPRLESESVPTDEDRTWRAVYDSELARALPALVFHRLWQSTKTPLSEGVLFDAEISWYTGRVSWSGAPIPWAWADSRNVSFAPETRIDEAFTFYCADTPHRKCRFWHTARRVDPAPDLQELAQLAKNIASLPACALVSQNIDAIILAPGVVAQLLRDVLPAFSASHAGLDAFARLYGASQDDACLGASLSLSSDPTFEAFGLSVPPLDARGQRTQSVKLVENGRAAGLVASDLEVRNLNRTSSGASHPRLAELLKTLAPNGHALDPEGRSAVFYPVLKGRDALPLYGPGLPRHVAQRTLVVETLRYVPAADSSLPSFIYMPEGGCLYENGLPVAQMPPHRIMMTLSQLLTHAQAASEPVFCQGMAVCALSLDPAVLFQNV